MFLLLFDREILPGRLALCKVKSFIIAYILRCFTITSQKKLRDVTISKVLGEHRVAGLSHSEFSFYNMSAHSFSPF